MAGKTILEAPPRTTGNAQNDFPLFVNWMFKLYETLISGGYYITKEELYELLSGQARADNLLWRDLKFPAQGINPPGAVSDPARSATTGLLEFSGTQDNMIAGVAQLDHDWAIGTKIYPHLHLMFPTASQNKTRWLFEYNRGNPDGSFELPYGSYNSMEIMTAYNPNNTRYHQMIAWPNGLDMTGYSSSVIIDWRITRLASSDAQDNDTSSVVLKEFDIHYQISRSGTANLMHNT